MPSNLVINVRCTCEEEFLLLHKLHKLYQEDQLRKRLKERLIAGSISSDGTVTETVERTFVPQAVDGGIDALGNPPLPEKPLTVDEARAIGTGYAEQEEELDCDEGPLPAELERTRLARNADGIAFNPNVEDYHPERGDSWKGIKEKPEITLTDVLEAEALENAERFDA